MTQGDPNPCARCKKDPIMTIRKDKLWAKTWARYHCRGCGQTVEDFMQYDPLGRWNLNNTLQEVA